ncbi:MAG: alpha/beta hydrolase, partial [Nanoarchaeota archaeon]
AAPAYPAAKPQMIRSVLHRLGISESEQFIVELQKTDIISAIKRITVPVLIIHGSSDLRVPFSDSEEILAALPKGSKLSMISGCDHLFDSNTCRDSLITHITNWFGKHL